MTEDLICSKCGEELDLDDLKDTPLDFIYNQICELKSILNKKIMDSFGIEDNRDEFVKYFFGGDEFCFKKQWVFLKYLTKNSKNEEYQKIKKDLNKIKKDLKHPLKGLINHPFEINDRINQLIKILKDMDFSLNYYSYVVGYEDNFELNKINDLSLYNYKGLTKFQKDRKIRYFFSFEDLISILKEPSQNSFRYTNHGRRFIFSLQILFEELLNLLIIHHYSSKSKKGHLLTFIKNDYSRNLSFSSKIRLSKIFSDEIKDYDEVLDTLKFISTCRNSFLHRLDMIDVINNSYVPKKKIPFSDQNWESFKSKKTYNSFFNDFFEEIKSFSREAYQRLSSYLCSNYNLVLSKDSEEYKEYSKCYNQS